MTIKVGSRIRINHDHENYAATHLRGQTGRVVEVYDGYMWVVTDSGEKHQGINEWAFLESEVTIIHQ